ncbi:MAG: hypothetical protein AAGK10_21445, partial [Cyanobacteria bacterium J06555_3]
MKSFFSDCFNVSPELIRRYGALNISLINDLPLFIDPFLLFHSEKHEYQELHESIIKYIVFLKDKSINDSINQALLIDWFTFPEVEENWLGFSVKGNKGRGPGQKFANSLHKNLKTVFRDFGSEEIYENSHLEKMCLIKDGIGRDNISDFTTNLIKDFLARYTQTFAERYLSSEQVRKVPLNKAYFNYETQNWVTKRYKLPFINNAHILLVPLDLLTKDESWINRNDLIYSCEEVARASSNEVILAQFNQYIARKVAEVEKTLPSNITKAKRKKIVEDAIETFPEIIDEYIDSKSKDGDKAVAIAKERIDEVIDKSLNN